MMHSRSYVEKTFQSFIIQVDSLSVQMINEYSFLGSLELYTPLDLSFDGTSDCANSSSEIDFCSPMLSEKKSNLRN